MVSWGEGVGTDKQENKKKLNQDQYISTLSFELENELKLGVGKQNADIPNALLDMFRLQFVDVLKELDALSVSCQPADREAASKNVRKWINSLNSAPLVPLGFRLKSLKCLEGFLDVLAKDMGSLIMRAYKAGVLHVKAKARDDPELYDDIVRVVSTALDLAIRQLQSNARKHYPPDVSEIRQSLNMAELGLTVARAAPKECHEEAARLKCFVAEHELLRRMELYSRTDAELNVIFKHLSSYALFADSVCVRKGRQMPRKRDGFFLIGIPAKPHLKPKRQAHLPEVAPEDCIVLSVQSVAKQAMEDLEKVRNVELETANHGVIHLEKDLSETKDICKTIIRSLRVIKRPERQAAKKEDVHADVHIGINLPEELMSSGQDSHFSRKGWVLHNQSKRGAMLQCPLKDGAHVPVRSILSFRWSKKGHHSAYGLVRWVEATPHGYQRMGVEFMPLNMRPAFLKFVNLRSALVQGRGWPALMEKTRYGWRVWVETKEQHRSPLTVAIQSMASASSDICRIVPLRQFGHNYSIFRISEVLSMEEVKAMALMQGQEKKKKSLDELKF